MVSELPVRFRPHLPLWHMFQSENGRGFQQTDCIAFVILTPHATALFSRTSHDHQCVPIPPPLSRRSMHGAANQAAGRRSLVRVGDMAAPVRPKPSSR